MKNKHLVLLFIITLVLGIILKRFPWSGNASVPAVDLLRLDTSAVSRISILLPGKQEMTIDRGDQSWVAGYGTRTVAIESEFVSSILAALHPLRVGSILHSGREDTLGLGQEQAIQVQIKAAGNQLESMLIGYSDSNGTWIKLPRHDGVYRVTGDLRQVFSIDFDQIRTSRPCVFRRDQVKAISISIWRGDAPVHLLRVDTLNRWISEVPQANIAHDSILMWLEWLQRMNHAGFADFFDESSSGRIEKDVVALKFDKETLVLRFYHLEYTDLPEDTKSMINQPRNQACYILESSRYPNHYYAVYDTHLVARIFAMVPGIRSAASDKPVANE